MTDPVDAGGSEVDRRFRADLRKALEEAERDETSRARAATPAAPAQKSQRASTTTAAAAKPPRSRSEVLMDWAPLAVGILAIAAVIGIALYGIAGGDLGPWGD
jgi:hypothetical protein